MSAAPQRDVAIDALRGFALLGIMVVNVPFFAGPTSQMPGTGIDTAAFWFVAAFGMGKFFLIFSFLFGFGFSLMLSHAAAEGRPIGPRFFRRLGVLFAFGALHAVFLFFGDILMLYSLLGFVLWLCRNWSRGALLAVAVLAGVIGLLLQAGAMIILPEVAFGFAAEAQRTANYLGTFWQVTAQRVADLPDTLSFILIFNGLPALSMFFLGLAFGRNRIFPPPPESRVFAIGRICFVFGALISGIAIWFTILCSDRTTGILNDNGVLAMLAVVAAGPILSFGMATTALGHFNRHKNGRMARWLAMAGGSSLSGYVLHSALLATLFCGWGFGYYNGLGATALLAIGIATWLIVVTATNLWRKVFRYGPDEWLLRSLTDLRWKPFLNSVAVQQK